MRPYAEIAAELDATPGSVKAAAARLRRDFRERLDRTLADGLAAGGKRRGRTPATVRGVGVGHRPGGVSQ